MKKQATYLDALPQHPILKWQEMAVMVGGGSLNSQQLKTIVNDGAKAAAGRRPVIAADGGADRLLAEGIIPDYVIGDFDSIIGRDRIPAERQIIISDQGTTDFQKLLAVVEVPLVVGFGFLGGRIDHSLAATYAIAKASPKMTVILVGDNDAMIFCRKDFTTTLPSGTRLSLWPAGMQRFEKSFGLVWPLDGLKMGYHAGLGTSNAVAGSTRGGQTKVEIKCAKAENGKSEGYFVITEAKYLNQLIESAQIAISQSPKVCR